MYGGHDYYLTNLSSPFGGQETVTMTNTSEVEPDVANLMTVVVTQENISFFKNLELLETISIKRPITDCFNSLEGMLVGDTGLSIAQLKFYPKALSLTSIEEIYLQGSTLDEISTGSVPETPTETDLQKVERSIQTTVNAIDKTVKDQQPLQEYNSVLSTVEGAIATVVAKTFSPSMPLGRIAMNKTLHSDPSVPGRQHYQLMKGPWHLDMKKIDDVGKANGATFDGERYWHQDDFPKTAGTGVTYAYWFKNGYTPEDLSWGTFHIAYMTGGTTLDSRCYGLYWETSGIWTDLQGGKPSFAYPLWKDLHKSYTPKFQISDRAWRHIAWVFDENDDTVTYYLDGFPLQKRAWGKSVKEMDCAPANVTIGFRYPGTTYFHPVRSV